MPGNTRRVDPSAMDLLLSFTTDSWTSRGNCCSTIFSDAMHNWQLPKSHNSFSWPYFILLVNWGSILNQNSALNFDLWLPIVNLISHFDLYNYRLIFVFLLKLISWFTFIRLRLIEITSIVTNTNTRIIHLNDFNFEFEPF